MSESPTHPENIPPSNISLKELTRDLFGSYKRWNYFLKQFNEYFPMPTSYQDDISLKFSPSAIRNGQISCSGAAIVMSYWALENKPGYNITFVTKRKPHHTHVYIGFAAKKENEDSSTQTLKENSLKLISGLKPKQDTRWYHLTTTEGLHRIEDSKIPVSELSEAMKYYYNNIPTPNEALPRYQLFTYRQALQSFFEFDNKHRTEDGPKE